MPAEYKAFQAELKAYYHTSSSLNLLRLFLLFYFAFNGQLLTQVQIQ
jgi:hypothetical protein